MLRGDVIRRHGVDVVTMADLAMLRYESGALRNPEISTTESSLILSWLRDKDLVERLKEARRIEQHRIANPGVV